MASKFVFNPFTGTFDAIDVADITTWADLECGIPDYIVGRPITRAEDGSLHVAEMVTTYPENCRVITVSGETVYYGTPAILP
jgi:hypothetical protein